MKNLLPFLLIAFSTLLFSQSPEPAHPGHATSTVCSGDKKQYIETIPLKEEQLDRFQMNTNRAVSSQTTYVESIHSVFMKFELDQAPTSSLAYAIGTDPNTYLGQGNLIYWSSLRLGTRKTRSYSLPEILQLNNPGAAGFGEGVDFYISLSIDDQVEVFGPYQFQWEDLGNPSNILSVDFATEWSLDSDGATVISSNGFTQGEVGIVQDFCTKMIPIIKEIYGAPSHSYEVTFVKNGNLTSTNVFFGGSNEIHVGAGNYNLDHRLLTHEMVHAFHDNVGCSSNDIWHYEPTLSGFEEGFAEGVAFECMTRFNEVYPGYLPEEDRVRWNGEGSMDFEWNYDFQNHRQVTTQDYWSSDQGTGSHWVRYGMGAAAMRKIRIENENIFQLFNQEYYSRMNSNHSLLPTRSLMISCFDTHLFEIERTAVSEWFNQQRIFDCSIDVRKKIFMLTFHGLSWMNYSLDNRLFLIETGVQGKEWSWDINDGNDQLLERWYHQMNNIPGSFSIYNSTNNLVVSQEIINDHHPVIEPGGAYAGQSLLGPYQGPNPVEFNGQFAANQQQDQCDILPDCGKMPFAMGGHPIYTTTADPSVSTTAWEENSTVWFGNNGIQAPNVQFGLRSTGLFRYEVSFQDPQGPAITERYYRLNGDDFIDIKGIMGGIHFEDNNTIASGRMFIEHENTGPEPAIVINNQSFNSERSWGSVPETDPNWYGDRPDRKYSTKGEIHGIYLDDDCNIKKIDFRNIGYGEGLHGVQMLKFKVDDMEDILFETSVSSPICEGEEAILNVSNNFPDIFNGDDRITFNWISPSGNSLSADSLLTLSAVTLADTGIYNLEISFFECPLFSIPTKLDISDNASSLSLVDTSATVCEEGNIIFDQYADITGDFLWSGPNGFSSNENTPTIANISTSDEGIYEVVIQHTGCNGETASDTSFVTVEITANISLDTPNINDYELCLGDPLNILGDSTNNPDYTYAWTHPDGSSSSSNSLDFIAIDSSEVGTYTFTLQTMGCDSEIISEQVTFNISAPSEPVNSIDILGDSLFCLGEEIVLSIEAINDSSIYWIDLDGDTIQNNSLNFIADNQNLSGTYSVVAQIEHCDQILEETSAISILIRDYSDYQLSSSTANSICEGETLNLSTTDYPDATYEWLDPFGQIVGTSSQLEISNISPDQFGTYTVSATFPCPGQTTSNNIETEMMDEELCNMEPHIYIPNGFSPNGDGINDVFLISGKGVKTFQLSIYNRWGEIVYTSNQFEQQWDGNYKGTALNSAVFSFRCVVQFEDNRIESNTGNISLIR